MRTYAYKGERGKRDGRRGGWEGGGETLVLRYVHTKWMAPNKCCGIFILCIGLAKYTKASPPARKMSSFSSIIITIILFHAIIRTAQLIYLLAGL